MRGIDYVHVDVQRRRDARVPEFAPALPAAARSSAPSTPASDHRDGVDEPRAHRPFPRLERGPHGVGLANDDPLLAP